MNHPPESPRLLFAAPAASILVALGFTQIGHHIARLNSPITVPGESPKPWFHLHNVQRAHTVALLAALVATQRIIILRLFSLTRSKRRFS